MTFGSVMQDSYSEETHNETYITGFFLEEDLVTRLVFPKCS